ncbi:MAG: hypothetical protein VR64_04470 [Desulfatitalea sp. BRH_c12]|nr:MAG: hypothetical protein VR64_04470 [Desulfatitalea sp. BRH_c12]
MHPFDKDILSEPSAQSDQWVTRIAGNWSINDLPNGGYQMAVLANAMLRVSAKKKIAIMTATFIARTTAGNARIHLEKIAASSQFERFEARLVQKGVEKLRALGTFVSEDMACSIDRRESSAPDIAPLAECVPIPVMPKFTLFDHMDVRLDPRCAGWMDNRLVDKSEHKGWIRFKDERPYDANALLLIADAFPPPVFASQGLAAWVPTIELSVNIRKLPSSQWLKCNFRTRFISCGLLEEDGEIWDEAGDLVALSRQIAQYRHYHSGNA